MTQSTMPEQGAQPTLDYGNPDFTRFDRDLETKAAIAAESARWNRERGSAPVGIRYDNPRFRRPGSKKSRGGRRGRKKPLPGVYLGQYTDRSRRVWDLRADGVQPRGVLIMGPPGSGKSACFFIPTLLATAGVDEDGRGMSSFVYDPKGELFALTAGYRQAMGHKVLLFAPAAADALNTSCHINILDSIRWGTVHEIADVQNVVKLILDPKDKAAEGAEAHWIVTGSILLECVIIWLHYNDPKNCSLKGCYDYLTDPRWVKLDEDQDAGGKPKRQTTAVDEALKHMMKVPHAPSGGVDEALQNGWKDAQGDPSAFHPYVIHSAVEIQGKAPNEKSGVVSTTTRFLHPFRDEILAELTSRSDFSFDDLMNHSSPVSLYFVIPPSDVQRLRVIVSLFLQLLVRAHTGDNALEYRDGVPYYRYRHRLLLAVDEYAQLGKQEQFILALSIMRSYGLWPMLGVQSPNQIFDSLGRYQALTSMMYYKVFLKPNDKESADWISENLGETTKKKEEASYSGGRFGLKMHSSVRILYEKGKLLAGDTLMSMPSSAGIVCGGSVNPKQWDNPIWISTLFWEHNPEMCRRSGNRDLGGRYPAPRRTDFIVHGPPAKRPKHIEDLDVAADAKLRGPKAPAPSADELAASLVGASRAAGAPLPTTRSNAEIAEAARRLIDEAAHGGAKPGRGAAAPLEVSGGPDPDTEPVEPAEVDAPVALTAGAAIAGTVAPLTDAMRQFLELAGEQTPDLGAAATDGLSGELAGEPLDDDAVDFGDETDDDVSILDASYRSHED